MAGGGNNPLKKKQEQVEKNRDKTVETTKEVKSFIVREHAILFNVVGLKPTTRHYFYFDNVDNSSKCAPESGKKGDSLISDKNGKITFVFFYDSDIDASTDRQKVVSEVNRIAGVKEIRIESSDGVSIATHQITIKVTTSNNEKPYFTIGGIGGVGVGVGGVGVGGAGF